MARFENCTCSEYQLAQVGCDCGAEQAWIEAPKLTVEVWPNGYANSAGTRSIKMLATATEAQINAEVRRLYSFGSISSIRRPSTVAPVSEEYARMMTKGDNT